MSTLEQRREQPFAIGALGALHEQGVLRTVDVISAVSGGSYALSWYLLQQFYSARAAGADDDGRPLNQDARHPPEFVLASVGGHRRSGYDSPSGDTRPGWSDLKAGDRSCWGSGV